MKNLKIFRYVKTTIIGILFMLLSGYEMYVTENVSDDVKYFSFLVLVFATGFFLLFRADQWIDILLNFLKNLLSVIVNGIKSLFNK